MPSSRNSKPNSNFRFFWLGIFIVLLFGGYSVGWFWFAGKAESEVRKAITSVNRDGVLLECSNPQIKGFPFRIGLFCDQLSYKDAGRRISANAGSFRTASQVYQPMRTILEVDGPLLITAPGLPQLQFNWDLLHASARIAQPLPTRISLETRKLSVQAELVDNVAKPLFTAEETQTHLRPNGAHIDLSGTFTGLVIDSQAVGGRRLPRLDGSADTTLNNGVSLVANRQPALRGQSGAIRSMTLKLGGTSGVSLNGPWSIAEDGLVDADLKVTIQNPRELSCILSEVIPEQKKQFETAFSGLTLFGDAPTLPLKIVKGKATLGFIPLGMVPAID